MPTKVVKKRHSWPSSQQAHPNSRPESFDDDPWAQFISPPLDDGDLIYNSPDVTAETSTVRPELHRSYSLSPDLTKARRFLLHHGPASSPVFKLKRWIQRMEQRFSHYETPSPELIEIFPNYSGYNSPQSPPEDYIPPEPWRPKAATSRSLSPPIRGRNEYRVGSGHRARRTRAWHAPSPELWTVGEEEEGDGVGLGIGSAEQIWPKRQDIPKICVTEPSESSWLSLSKGDCEN